MSSNGENFATRLVEVESFIPAFDEEPAQTQTLKLATSEWGSAEADAAHTYILVHGITSNLQWWQALARQLLANATEPIRLIALDLRGRGNSDKPDSPYHVAAAASDIGGLLDALHITEPINYVGHSLGAHIGTYFASHYPERVRRLILIDGGARLPDDVAQSIAASLSRIGQIYPNYEAYVAPLKTSGIFPEWTADVERAYHYDWQQHENGGGSKMPRYALDQELNHIGKFYQEVDSYYPQIKAPTLILRAPKPVAAPLSPFLTPNVLAVMTNTLAGGSEIINVPDTNHYTVILQPSLEMVEAILQR